MGNSLQDQLLKAGLVDARKLKQAEQQKRGQKKAVRKGNKPKTAPDPRLAEEARMRAERDRELNRKQQEKAERKAREAQIRQLIEEHRLADISGDILFNFQHGGKIKRMYLKPEIRERVMQGRLAIALLNGRLELVPLEIGQRIAERDERRVVIIPIESKDQPPAEDDPYAGYEVPDDLMW